MPSPDRYDPATVGLLAAIGILLCAVGAVLFYMVVGLP